jgi:DNA-binding transcriptional MerR regulator
MWERRYGVVVPSRSGGRNRLYTHEDIGRLALLKRLVDAGDAIGSVAHLSLEQLQERIEVHKAQGSLAPMESGQERARPRVMVLGDALPAVITQREAEIEGVDFVGVFRERQSFESELNTLRPNVIVVEYPTVHSDTAADVNTLLARSGAERALVVYGFGPQSAIRQLDTAQIAPLRAPVGLPELRHTLLAANGGTHPEHGFGSSEELFEIATRGPMPTRQFDNDTLAAIAIASTAVHCECPHHLVELIRSLVAFEQYSTECKNNSPKDAELHGLLEATTAKARSLMETALAHVVEAEGVQI